MLDLKWSPTDQARFIKQSLGPAFRKYSISTKIIIFDHNCDTPDYPITILNDSNAKQYVDGSAFHWYGGNVKAMSYAKIVLQWTLASNPKLEPHTDTGCSRCLGAITIDGNEIISRNVGYYINAHASKFVRPNSIILNENDQGKQTFQIQCYGRIYNTSLNGGSVATYIC